MYGENLIRFLSQQYHKVYTMVQTRFYQKEYQEKIKEAQQLPKTLQWNVYQRLEIKEELQHFLSQELDDFGFQTNSKNILFVTGPSGSGKTWFLKNAIQQMQQKPFVIDAKHYYSFDQFIYQFKIQLMNQISQTKLINTHDLVRLITKKYHINYLNIFYNNVLDQFEENIGSFIDLTSEQQELIIQFRLENSNKSKPLKLTNTFQENVKVLEFWDDEEMDSTNNKKISKINAKKVDFLGSFEQILDIIVQQSNDKDRLLYGLKLCMNIIDEIERQESNLKEPQICNQSSNEKQVDFLFDLLNYVSGLRDQNFDITPKLDVKREINPFSIILLNFDHLTDQYPYRKEVYDFLDHLILRCFNRTGIRNHVPIILESSDCKFFNRELYEMMQIDINEFYNIDLENLQKDQLLIQVEDFFSSKDFDRIYDKIGGQLQDWHALVKKYVEEDNFNLDNWLQQNHNYNQFEYLMSQLFVSPEVSEFLDQNKLEEELQILLEILIKFDGQIDTSRHYVDVTIMENPIVKALQRLKILYHPKYQSCIYLAHPYYLQHIKTYLQKLNLRIETTSTYQQKINRFLIRNFPLIDHPLRTKLYKIDKSKRIDLIDDLDEPRERPTRDDKKGARPYHWYFMN